MMMDEDPLARFGRGPIEARADDVREGDAVGGAALGLLGLMTGLSEEFWCAGWMSGLEYSLWNIRESSGDDAVLSFGMGEVSPRQRTLLRLLSDECGGWWAMDRSYSVRFVPLDEWRSLLVPSTES